MPVSKADVTRLPRFKSMAAVMAGSRHDLVSEYANVLLAKDHEFQTAASRDAYARAVYAIGAFIYGEDFETDANDSLWRLNSGVGYHYPATVLLEPNVHDPCE